MEQNDFFSGQQLPLLLRIEQHLLESQEVTLRFLNCVQSFELGSGQAAAAATRPIPQRRSNKLTYYERVLEQYLEAVYELGPRITQNQAYDFAKDRFYTNTGKKPLNC